MSYLVDDSVSIILPIFNRKKFEKMIEYNIINQDYPFIKEIIIGDDSDIDKPIHLGVPYTIKYCKLPRCTIGQKRDFLVREATGKYVINFDSDDFYKSNYVSHSVFTLKYKNKKATGSGDMIIYNGKRFFKQRCIYLYLLNEGTMCIDREWYLKTCLYLNQSNGEAALFLRQNIKDICETDELLMCCVSHSSNTIDKKIWENDNYNFETNEYKNHIDLLSTLNI